jgi:hypothetical protein
MAYSQEQLEALQTALTRGEKRVFFEGKSVEYRSPEELKLAIKLVERELRISKVAQGRQDRPPRQIRVTTRKGF